MCEYFRSWQRFFLRFSPDPSARWCHAVYLNVIYSGESSKLAVLINYWHFYLLLFDFSQFSYQLWRKIPQILSFYFNCTPSTHNEWVSLYSLFTDDWQHALYPVLTSCDHTLNLKTIAQCFITLWKYYSRCETPHKNVNICWNNNCRW